MVSTSWNYVREENEIMNGRLEHELKLNKNVKKILNDMPQCVSDFYMSIQAVRSPNTCLNYVRKLHHFLDYIDVEDISEIDADDIARYLEHIKYVKDGNGKIKKSSVAYTKLVCCTLNRFFDFLYRRGDIERNPMDNVNRPIRKDSIKRVFLSMDDLNGILGAVKYSYMPKEWHSRDYAILYLFMVTGMRKTALSEINLSDLNFETHNLTIIDKRDKEQVYQLNDDSIRVLRDWILDRDKILYNMGIKEDALFISKNGKRMDPQTIYCMVVKYAEKGIGKHVSPHKLRAAFASLYYKETKDIVATKNAVGHADIQTTSIYTVEENNSRKEATEFMSKNLSSKI